MFLFARCFAILIFIYMYSWLVAGTHLVHERKGKKERKKKKISDGLMHMIRHRENRGKKGRTKKITTSKAKYKDLDQSDPLCHKPIMVG